MYKVIIADDEPWVVYNLVHGIDWEAQGFIICDTADNGPQALIKCLSQKPDVLFSDIRMPGLDGLELLERLRNELPDIEVILISGYAEFRYAQHALRHGAADYLIKPVSAIQHIEVLEKLKNRLKKKTQSILSDAYFALLDEDDMLSVAEWAKFFSHDINYPYFRFLTFSDQSQDQSNWLKESWLPDIGQLIFRTGRNKYSAIIGYTTYDIYMDWYNNFTGGNFRVIGISQEEISSYSFSSLHRQADIAYSTAKITGPGVTLIYHKETPSNFDQQIHEYIKLIENTLNNGDTSMCIRLLSQISQLCHGLMLDRITDLFNTLICLIKRYYPVDTDALEPYSYRRLALEFNSIEAIFDFLEQSLQASDNTNSAEALGQNIIQFIDEHYTEELYLPYLASHYHFSPSYFSTLFKKHTGTTLTKYITIKRIALAKQLLSESDLSIQDIVERVGYNDYFQFIKVFKREVGITPGNYRGK